MHDTCIFISYELSSSVLYCTCTRTSHCHSTVALGALSLRAYDSSKVNQLNRTSFISAHSLAVQVFIAFRPFSARFIGIITIYHPFSHSHGISSALHQSTTSPLPHLVLWRTETATCFSPKSFMLFIRLLSLCAIKALSISRQSICSLLLFNIGPEYSVPIISMKNFLNILYIVQSISTYIIFII